MDMVSRWINVFAFLSSGYIYVYTLQRKEESRRYQAAGIVLFFLFVIVVNNLPFESLAAHKILLEYAGFFLLVWLLHLGIRLTWNAAVYYGIWAFLTWQLLSEMWLVVIRLYGIFPGGGYWFSRITGVIIYAIGYVFSALTIGKFMPEGGEKKIGPRQLILAIWDFLVLQILSYMFGTLEVTLDDLRWLILYMAQLLLAITLYLQNELFKKSDMRQEMEMMNLLRKKEQEQYRLSKENLPWWQPHLPQKMLWQRHITQN